MGFAQAAGVQFVQEVFATAEVVKRLEPDTSCVIELGGEDAKVIFFDGGRDERMNGTCAGRHRSVYRPDGGCFSA